MNLFPDNLMHAVSYATILSQLLFWLGVLISLDEYDSLSVKILDQQKRDTDKLDAKLNTILNYVKK